jgi:hypothetical protein
MADQPKANQRKTTFEAPIVSAAEAGPSEDPKKLAEALANASSKFFEVLRISGLKPVAEGAAECGGGDAEGCGEWKPPRGGYDRSVCGHDRS